jgi:3-dehydroquinate synthetase
MVCDLAGFVLYIHTQSAHVRAHVPLLWSIRGRRKVVDCEGEPNRRYSRASSGRRLRPRLCPAPDCRRLGEVIKHGLILDEELLRLLEENAEAAVRLDPQVAERVIARSVALKAAVVSEDEREETGRRMVLNYGHTIGHGLEAAGGYAGLLHGEAVAVGMSGAARIAVRLGILAPVVAERQDALLARFGLPLCAPGVDARKALESMALDKKAQRGAVRWVLLGDIGRTVIRRDVPTALVEEVLAELTAVQP